jgi:IclR family acetate operon transcriptional repressor
MSVLLGRALGIVECLADKAEGMTLTVLSQHLKLPKSAAHRLLATLVEAGYVCQDGITSRYQLTMRLPALAFRYLGNTGLTEVCQPVLDRLAAKTDELVRLAVVDGDELVWVARAQGADSTIRYSPPIGRGITLHATATGKIWLSSLDDERALRIVLAKGFETKPNYGRNAVRSPVALIDALRETRERGFGIALDEGEFGSNAAAVAIKVVVESKSKVVGTISVAGPMDRLPLARLEKIAIDLHAAADELAMLWPIRRHLVESEGLGVEAEYRRQKRVVVA